MLGSRLEERVRGEGRNDRVYEHHWAILTVGWRYVCKEDGILIPCVELCTAIDISVLKFSYI